jgi:transposase
VDTGSGVITEDRVKLTVSAVEAYFDRLRPELVALEVGTHSPWLSRTLRRLGIAVLVANARRLHLISRSDTKNDRADAELLARLAAADPALLSPIEHRGERAQAGLAVLRARDALVKSRTSKLSQVRGVAKSFGLRLPKHSSSCFAYRVRNEIPALLAPALHPLLDAMESETALIKDLDKEIQRLSDEEFPETRYLRQVNGVGVLTALAFVLVLEDPRRFVNSRAVGAYLGLRPRQHESGTIRKQMHITKAGDAFLRVLLVQCAQYILGPFGTDCDLRRWGLKRAERGGKNAKRRAVVAVARKLSTVLHRLWTSELEYEPLRSERRKAA